MEQRTIKVSKINPLSSSMRESLGRKIKILLNCERVITEYLKKPKSLSDDDKQFLEQMELRVIAIRKVIERGVKNTIPFAHTLRTDFGITYERFNHIYNSEHFTSIEREEIINIFRAL